jgi:D-alanyl-lipoteichoic acid acyltransferase DltB (MBOAT superfamily)
MSFISTNFVIFFTLYMLFFFLVPLRWRWVYILMASYYFYMCARPEYVLLLIGTTTFDYFAALLINRTRSRELRKLFLIGSLSMNIGVLALFKYARFIGDSINLTLGADWLPQDATLFQLLLPVGISFFTFQSMSYTIDIYRGVIPPERHWGRFAAFVAFFPQLVSGPIERAAHLLPQMNSETRFDPRCVADGMRLILLGFFKKTCIANPLDGIVGAVFGSPERFGGAMHMAAAVMFAAQIYCDFSGYTDIAIGAARVQGYRFRPNFRQPYLSTSFTEFWRRWHISLSSWFRDYLYLSLGGSRTGVSRSFINLWVVFLLSGLWHGANFTFIMWGALHAAYLSLERMCGAVFARVPHVATIAGAPAALWFRRALVFVLVCIAWVLFRCQDMREAGLIYTRMFHASLSDLYPLFTPAGVLPTNRAQLLYLATSLAILSVVEVYLAMQPRFVARIWAKPSLRICCYVLLFQVIVFTGVFGPIKFIYFQF